MSIINNSAIADVKQNNFIRIIKGSITSIILTVVILFVFALLLAYTNMPESIITPIVISTSGFSILIGSIISSLKIKKQGIINGGAVGFVYILTIYILSSIIQNDFGLNTSSIIMIVVAILVGALGGIIGVNIKRK